MYIVQDCAPSCTLQNPVMTIARGTIAVVALWRARITDRRVYAAMDDRLLAEIGLTRLDADRRASTPFWRA